MAGLDSVYASHTGRKTFGFMNRVERGASIDVLQKAYGHTSPATTLTYLCIQDDELRALYSEAL